MNRICCYSLSIPDGSRPDLLTQIITSVDSLRAYNKEVSIVLFAYGNLPMNLVHALQMRGVRIWVLPSYSTRLSQLCPLGWQFLSQYPLLHKFLNFAEISSLNPDQVLLLDCDTYFQGDVGKIFEQYNVSDVVAREEVGSRRSSHGYQPGMIDEDNLSQIGNMAGIKPAPPFNLGVVLLNNGIWKKLAGLSTLHISYAWRFMVWMAANPGKPDSEFGEGVGIEDLRQHWFSLSPVDQFLALPYPSQNRWILDEVTLWMTLGHLPNTTFQDFNHTDVIQNGEFTEMKMDPNWVVCHYFSQNLELISNWVRNKPQFIP
jgi:hypothetical protein